MFVQVMGTVVARNFAIALGDSSTDRDQYVLIESTGYVAGYIGAAAVDIHGSTSVVENHGRISSLYQNGGLGFAAGVYFDGSGAGESRLINTGIIEGYSSAGPHSRRSASPNRLPLSTQCSRSAQPTAATGKSWA
jgi:hypothetical protein